MKTRIVLLGPPASGKGTQAELIVRAFEIPTASPGAMLREERKAGTALGLEADQFTSRGQLLPDAIIVNLVSRWLDEHGDRFLFDGFPRTTGQADALSGLLNEIQKPLEVAISLETTFEAISERISRRWVCLDCGANLSVGLHIDEVAKACPRCGGAITKRVDDTLDVLQERMREYREKSEPLLSYYEQRNLLRRVDANQTPEQVFEEITDILKGA